MSGQEWLAGKFEENRGHLRGVAYRMLGSASEADDAIQETWLRLSRSDASQIENLGGWLTTVVARVCLDMLRARTSRHEESLEEELVEPAAPSRSGADPEKEAMLADSVGIALLVVLNRLTPAERLSFVLHDMFAVPFEEIGSIVGRTPEAARQLASRARRRVQGGDRVVDTDVSSHREVVEAFVGALRRGDIEGIVAVLDPDVVVRIDEGAAGAGAAREIRGARNWASGAVAFSGMAKFTKPMLVDGQVGLVLAPGGKLARVLRFSFAQGKIAQVDIIADPERLKEMELGVLEA